MLQVSKRIQINVFVKFFGDNRFQQAIVDNIGLVFDAIIQPCSEGFLPF